MTEPYERTASEMDLREALGSEGPLQLQHTRALTGFLRDHIETMRRAGEGSVLSGPSISIQFGGITDIGRRVMDASWNRLNYAPEVHADAESVRNMGMIWFAAANDTGSDLTYAFVDKHPNAVSAVMQSEDAALAFDSDDMPDYWRTYRDSVVSYIAAEAEDNDIDSGEFPVENVSAFAGGLLHDADARIGELELVSEAVRENEALYELRPVLVSTNMGRIEQQLDQDAPEALTIDTLIEATYVKADADDEELRQAVARAASRMLERIDSFPPGNGTDVNARDSALRYIANYSEYLKAADRQRLVGYVQGSMDEKAARGFNSVDELRQASTQAALLMSKTARTEHERREKGKAGELAAFVEHNMPFFRSFFQALNGGIEGADANELAAIRKNESGLAHRLVDRIKDFPDIFSEPHELFDLLFPDGLVEQYRISEYVKEPIGWLNNLENRLNPETTRFEYDFDFKSVKVGQESRAYLERLRRYLPGTDTDAQEAIGALMDSIADIAEWEPGEPPIDDALERLAVVRRSLEAKSHSIVDPYFVAGISAAKDGSRIVEDEPGRLMRGVKTGAGLIKAEWFIPFQLGMMDAFSGKRRYADGDPAREALASQTFIRRIRFIRAVFNSLTEPDIDTDNKVKVLAELINAVAVNEERRGVGLRPNAEDTLDRFRLQSSEYASEASQTIDAHLRTSDGWGNLLTVITAKR